jgi:hypothetical protein
VTEGVWVAEAPQRFFGLEVGARMTVLDTGQGLLVHSPIALPPAEAARLGALRFVVAPNRLHHLYAGPYLEAGLEGWAAPGLAERRPDLRFAGVLDGRRRPFGEEVEVIPLRCFSLTQEVVLYHRPSRTLVVTDLVFHFTARSPWLTRCAMACAGGYPGCSMTVLERLGFRRSVAREEMAALLRLDFDRLIMAHGEVIETGGKQALARATAWLGLPRALLGG